MQAADSIYYGNSLNLQPYCEKSHELLHSHYTDRSDTIRKIKDAYERFDAGG